MKKDTLTVKFTHMFVGFTLVTLAVTFVISYFNQMHLYKQQREESVQFVASYLNSTFEADDIYFVWYQKYFLKNSDSILVPYDFDDLAIQDARHEYEDCLSKDFPGKVLGVDLDFDELTENGKTTYEVYSHEFYQAAFDKANDIFDLAYTYYVVPKDDGSDDVTFILDCKRDEKAVGGKKYLDLGRTVTFDRKNHKRFWETWDSGKKSGGNDVFVKDVGKTYAYYTPVFIGGEKMGVIGMEVEVSTITHAILVATLRQMLLIALVLVLFVGFLLFIIRKNYIQKLVYLQRAIDDYSRTKNSDIAYNLLGQVKNKDEISMIMSKLANMIYELRNYMDHLSKTRQDLQKTQKVAMELSELAVQDSLTGIRNKRGYDKEVRKAVQEIADGQTKIGLAMIDLNYLKKINDTYGHDKGNVSLITLCQIVCHVFDHSPVFRIGGDEFAVVLRGHDLEHIDELVEEFNQNLKELQDNEELKYWEKISAAIGYAVYDPALDSDFDALFKRADDAMYKNKEAMKAARE